MAYSKEDVKELIELEDVCTLLEYFSAEPELYSDYIISKTICHGGDSKKLYYYAESQLFMCYTKCDESFDIFELIQKVLDIGGLNEAVYWAVNFFNLTYKLEDSSPKDESEDWKIFNRYDKIDNTVFSPLKELEYKTYNPAILEFYPQPEILPWTKDGISKEVCDYMGIRYDPIEGNILIPHKNEYGDLIGIRQRTLVQENEKYGKYRPWKYGDQLYNHPLSFNLFGLDLAKENIKRAELAIVVEGEKSVLQYVSYFGIKNNLCVAVCGNKLSKYQFQLLQKYGAKEIVIGFDRDFEDNDEKGQEELEKKLQKIYDKYSSMANISFLYDAQRNKLGYKCSPTDAGKETFLYLFRNRVIL